MGHLTNCRAVRWLAPVALAGSLGLVACGDSGSDVTAETTAARSGAAAAAGSDVHLTNLAAEAEGRATSAHLDAVAAAQAAAADVHLANLVSDAQGRQVTAATGSDRHLENMAVAAAEAAEREAHLAGSASTAERNADTGDSDSTEDEFVPGSRRMPMR